MIVGEPSIEELLAEPAIQIVMRRDRVQLSDLLSLLAAVQKRIKAAGC